MFKFPSLRFAPVPGHEYFVVEPTAMVKTLSAVHLERSKDSGGLIDGTANAFYATIAILSLYVDGRGVPPGTIVLLKPDQDPASLLPPNNTPTVRDLVPLLPSIIAAYKSEQAFGAESLSMTDPASLPVNLVDSDRSGFPDFSPGTSLATVLEELKPEELRRVRDFWMSSVPDTFLALIYKTVRDNNFWNLGAPPAGN